MGGDDGLASDVGSDGQAAEKVFGRGEASSQAELLGICMVGDKAVAIRQAIDATVLADPFHKEQKVCINSSQCLNHALSRQPGSSLTPLLQKHVCCLGSFIFESFSMLSAK